MDPSLLEERLPLREIQYLCERFEKSPNLTESCAVADHLSICYARQDTSAIPTVRDLFLRMYQYVKNWFGYRGDMAIELWLAPSVADLQYMTCMPCGEGYACAPGNRNGANVIILDSPLSGGRNTDKTRFSTVLAHEIAHHFVTNISRATRFTMKRKEEMDVPMWLEEGLGTVIMAEIASTLQAKLDEDIAKTNKWYALNDIWNDLSSCADMDKAYLQAYKETKALVEKRGKAEIVRLLYLNRTHYINWNDLPCGEKALTKARHVNTAGHFRLDSEFIQGRHHALS